jgi:hypothetical protein
MIDRPAMSSTALCALALCCCVAAGCAGVKHKPAVEPVPAGAPAVPAVSAPAPQPPVVSPQEAVTAPDAAVVSQVPEAREPAVPPPVVEPVPPAQRVAPTPRVVVPQAPVAAAPAPRVAGTKSPPASAPAPAPAQNIVSKATQAPAASPSAAAPLDFASLGTRLRQTKAIGTLTKLSLKNQVDDLLGKFRAYHKRQGTATLPELRRSYDMLLLKVLSLLQDSDPPLARDIVQSRAAIWGILADPRKFTESNLMAGATT